MRGNGHDGTPQESQPLPHSPHAIPGGWRALTFSKRTRSTIAPPRPGLHRYQVLRCYPHSSRKTKRCLPAGPCRPVRQPTRRSCTQPGLIALAGRGPARVGYDGLGWLLLSCRVVTIMVCAYSGRCGARKHTRWRAHASGTRKGVLCVGGRCAPAPCAVQGALALVLTGIAVPTGCAALGLAAATVGAGLAAAATAAGRAATAAAAGWAAAAATAGSGDRHEGAGGNGEAQQGHASEARTREGMLLSCCRECARPWRTHSRRRQRPWRRQRAGRLRQWAGMPAPVGTGSCCPWQRWRSA
jgi:hypothetical protein